ncbi:hypothetical protein BDV38DRAFT_86969 [Aspergillus pseudotamarii]|uniref:F-box domain-containing protein n=1 Tax=Aspergillus pseudotamarii TaxID=132259 RepID=A0A5N6SVL1_ASPPS|nr:uncharacterized protein BDV38DRAFT_86969 [Aspergillus pseudotamarii]KAE8137433.1 hypothetical protein BDV38DRAFT_86969 [Aspergillus pseudotamarii]
MKGPALTSDSFRRLPREIRNIILNYLNSQDIASLRLVSRAFHQLPISLWQRLLREKMPWLWEIWSDEPPYYWATVTAEDIGNNRREALAPGMSTPTIVSHTINVQEHMSQWALPKPPYGRTNWYMLDLDIKRNRKESRGLRNRERIWNYQEKMLVQLKRHIRDSAI